MTKHTLVNPRHNYNHLPFAPKKVPLVPGYSAVARVVEIGKEVKGFNVGDLVSGRNLPMPHKNKLIKFR